MLTVLSAHNYYRHPGGEDRVFVDEATLLEENGHTVLRHEDHNDRIQGNAFGAARDAIWSRHTFHNLEWLVHANSIDVAHFHNTFPLISPSGYYAVRRAGVPVVQTLHNFRLICAGATLSRKGSVCEACIQHRSLLPGITHGCYRDSRSATAAVSMMLTLHRAVGTYQKQVDVYIVPSKFAREKFVEAGFQQDRIVVKPNFVNADPGVGAGRGDYALFVGRLTDEKGVRTLVEAWHLLSDIPLRIAGAGPASGTTWPAGVTYLGPQTRDQTTELMKDASVVIVPSIWYEIGPLTILEAFACGTPVIASKLGSMAEKVRHRDNGLLFQPGDPEDLARQVRWAFDHPEELRAMRANARREYEEKYTAERNYKMLIAIYEMAIENFQRRRREAC